MDKITEALKLAEEALNAILTHMGMDEDEWTKPTFNQAREALAAILEALAEQSMAMILNDPHPPHRLCECTACLEYWTPLPDCDAFAASGKPIAETVKTYEQGYLDGYDAGLIFANSRVEPVKQEPVAHYKDAPHTIYLQTGCDDPEDCECSFNEWGDTTWCADQIHDTDIPYIRADYAAPLHPVKQEPVATVVKPWSYGGTTGVHDYLMSDGSIRALTPGEARAINAAPVSAKREWVDLTDDEIVSEFNKSRNNFDYASAVIAAFKEKNR